jgi:hypothetical protein
MLLGLFNALVGDREVKLFCLFELDPFYRCLGLLPRKVKLLVEAVVLLSCCSSVSQAPKSFEWRSTLIMPFRF